jgi:hypothetical protein
MKYDITVDGGETAEITIEPDGKGGFVGQIVSKDYGTGGFSDGVQDGNLLKGTVELDGYQAAFTATISGAAISGTLRKGWFFSKSFAGVEVS